MKKNQRLMVLVFCLALGSTTLALPLIHVASAATADDITKSLMCTCGCGKIVYDCDCELALQMKAETATMLSQGMTRDEIMDAFVEKYGEQVLATPPVSGFTLLLWLFPVFIAIGGTVIIYQFASKKSHFPTSKIKYPILDKRTAPPQRSSTKASTDERRYEENFYEEFERYRKRNK